MQNNGCEAWRQEFEESLKFRTIAETYDRHLCITCQTFLDRILTKSMYTKIHMLPSAPTSFSFCRLNPISNAQDAVTNDVIYHGVCWAEQKSKGMLNRKQLPYNILLRLSDISLINFIDLIFASKQNDITNMNIFNQICRSIL